MSASPACGGIWRHADGGDGAVATAPLLALKAGQYGRNTDKAKREQQEHRRFLHGPIIQGKSSPLRGYYPAVEAGFAHSKYEPNDKYARGWPVLLFLLERIRLERHSPAGQKLTSITLSVITADGSRRSENEARPTLSSEYQICARDTDTAGHANHPHLPAGDGWPLFKAVKAKTASRSTLLITTTDAMGSDALYELFGA